MIERTITMTSGERCDAPRSLKATQYYSGVIQLTLPQQIYVSARILAFQTFGPFRGLKLCGIESTSGFRHSLKQSRAVKIIMIDMKGGQSSDRLTKCRPDNRSVTIAMYRQ